MNGRATGFSAIFDLYFFEFTAPFKRRIDIRLFQIISFLLYGLFLLLLALLSLASCIVIKPLLEAQEGSGNTVTVIFMVGNIYLAGAYLLREIYSERRFAVAGSPNTSFYRALDVRPRDVFLVYCGLRTTAFFAAILVMDAVFVAAFGAVIEAPRADLLVGLTLPAAFYVLSLAVSAAVAGRRTSTKSVKWSALLPIAVALFGVGYGSARFIAEPVLSNGFSGAFGREQTALLLELVAISAPFVGCVSVVALWLYVRRLDRRAFPIELVDSVDQPATGTPSRQKQVVGSPSKIRILHREVTRSKVYPLVRKYFLVLTATLLVCFGAFASSASVLPVHVFSQRIPVGAYGFIFITFVILIGLVLTVVGPTTMAAQFRFEWENLLLSRWRIVISAGVYYTLSVVVLAIGVSALSALLLGHFTVGPVALAVAVAGAAMIGESTVSPKAMADGTSSHGTITALVVLLFVLPAVAAVSVGSVVFDCVAATYSLCLLGGGIACMARRVTTLPLRSAI